jgi:hypothetical protein
MNNVIPGLLCNFGGIRPNYLKKDIGKCYHPDWCNCTVDQHLYEKAMCISLALYEFQTTLLSNAINYSKLGMVEKTNKVYRELNRINHIATYLFGLYTQLYLNPSDKLENYITCKELIVVKEVLKCSGFDLTCILECLDLCGYTKKCTDC